MCWGGSCRHIAVIAAVLLFASTAIAQVIPQSEQLGRERERFTQPSAPQAQPGPGPNFLPSITAPLGAAETMIMVREIRVAGSTVYSPEQLRPLYTDLIGNTVSVQAIYDLARAITAKYGNDGYVLSRAIVPVQSFRPLKRAGILIQIHLIEGYVDRVVVARQPVALSQFLLCICGQDHGGPSGQYSHYRAVYVARR